MPYLWAAYRMNIWEGTLKPDLTQIEFTNTVAGLSELSKLMVLVADKPLGLVTIREDLRVLEPHIDWFPWATDRQKIVGSISGILELRKIKPVLIWSPEETRKFHTHLAKYGVIRRVGTFYGDEKYAIFQSKEA